MYPFFKTMCVAMLLFLSTGSLHAQSIRVGVFRGNGAAETCIWEAVAACQADSSLSVHTFDAADVACGVLNRLDVVVLPGGSGSREYLNLGHRNREALRTFVEKGGGVVGICAGAYLLSSTPGYSCMNMTGAEAIDIAHDNRGRGVAKVTLNEVGRQLFKEVAAKDTLYIMYYEGPVIVPSHGEKASYTTLGIMESDVHVEGNAPAGMTNRKPFFYLAHYGKGLVFSSVGHPEATPGMQWMLPRMVHRVTPTAKEQPERMSPTRINADRFGRELLMTAEKRQQEEGARQTLLHGTPTQKVEALWWIARNLSWDGKRWMQGLIYDEAPMVRKEAARVMAWCMYTYYLNDLRAALSTETEPDVRQEIATAIATLEGRKHS